MPTKCPEKRRWLGYLMVLLTVVVGLGLWIVALWAADAWYEDPWKYPAKVGSHGTLMLMCWAFILATRFRLIEWLFGGLDKVYRAHRVVGETAFFLIFLHPVFLAVAHADGPQGFFRYLWFSDDWVRNTGLIALIAFIILVVLSIYLKIAYHRWKRSHDFFGLLLVLIVVHAGISPGEIARLPLLTAWHGVWVVLGLSAYVYIRFLYRFIGPQYEVVTESVRDIGDSITEITLKPKGRRAVALEPGQFVYVSFDADAVSEEPHPFSVSNAPEADSLRLSIKRLGDWTRDVGAIQPGEPARIWGPYGHFTETLFRDREREAVLIGGGIGVTPILSILHSDALARRPGRIQVVYSTPTREKLVYDGEMRQRAKDLPQVHYTSHLSDEEGFIDRGYLESLVEGPLPDCLFLICGPKPMTDSLSRILTEADVPSAHIIHEDFAIR